MFISLVGACAFCQIVRLQRFFAKRCFLDPIFDGAAPPQRGHSAAAARPMDASDGFGVRTRFICSLRVGIFVVHGQRFEFLFTVIVVGVAHGG